MTVVIIHKAKTELSKLLARVEAGEEIVIARGNEPIAKLVSLASSEKMKSARKPGALAHLRDTLPPDLFLEPMSEDEIDAWEGKYSLPGDNGK